PRTARRHVGEPHRISLCQSRSEEPMSSKQGEDKARIESGALNRRKILLGGSTLAAASALGASAPTTLAQAQAQLPAPPSGQRPNILVIFGDDVGVANISAYSNGLMGY